MPKAVDLSLLRQMTGDAMRVYEAATQAGALNAETRRAYEAAEELLRQTTAAFLPDTTLITDHTAVSAPRQAMIADYVAIQKALAGLQDALYQLVQARIVARDWPAAQQAAHALVKIAPDYRDVSALSQKIPALRAEEEQQQRDLQERQRKAEEQRQRKAEEARQMLNALQWVRVPASPFLYGDANQKIRLEAFAIGKYPVTVAQFALFVRETGYNTPEAVQYLQQKGNPPVVQVSWNDATAFCEWASQITGKTFSLPTDEQWEKAARGTDGRKYPWGNPEPDNTCCNFDNQVGATTPVGRYSPKGDSPYGCADMAGNVWEWAQSRCLRGGAFNAHAENVRCAVRVGPTHPEVRTPGIGFRLCVSPI